jgi:tetratricopeptide (TPR) repeat protein
MTYHEEEQVKLRRQSSKNAITLAMEGRWREAVAANRSIIENFPNDVDARNRLGRACMELGDYAEARDSYMRALELDPYNAIAKKNVERLAKLDEHAPGLEPEARAIEPHHFIEEVGKAGVVTLHNLALPQIRAKMVAGDQVYLKIKGASLTVENGHSEYLGEVDYKYAQRLIKLMEGGNKYSAAIVSSSDNTITVIIRETYQDPSQAGRLSFPRRTTDEPRSYASDRMLKRQPEREGSVAEEFGYTIIDEEGVEVPFNESAEDDEKTEDEE